MYSLGVVNEDRISELPEPLILQILSLLPTKLSIATSVLSKEWKSHWKMLPKLKFDCCFVELGNFCRTLLSHKAPTLQSFHINVRLCSFNSGLDTGVMIGNALARNVRELVVEVESHMSFTFPGCLYSSETLETLKLRTRAFITDAPSTMCLKSLRTLHLDGVDFKDDESVLNLLSGCPNLENLEVHIYQNISVNTFIIAVPSLQRLSIHNYYCGNQHYVISSPSLKYLKIQGLNDPESCTIQNVPELVEASIINVYNITDENLLGPLTSVKRLSLDLPPVKMKFPIGNIFNQLVYLELHTVKEAWWNLFTLMLCSSPKLQVLKLNGRGWLDKHVAREEWNQPKNVPECLLIHLKTFMWESYKWDRQYEIEVAKYILSNTKYLKRATFTLKGIRSKDRLLVINDLKSVVKDKNSCQFQFK